jgi:hypothetical protein
MPFTSLRVKLIAAVAPESLSLPFARANRRYGAGYSGA